MKVIFKLFIIFCFTTALFFQESSAQLANQNMVLLGNVNQHSSTQLYSALWGYKAPDGREYAILGCGTGTAFIDITDSTNIHEVAYKTGPTSSWREMKTYSHYAYVVSEASNSGVQIFDLQYLPDSVHFVTTYMFGGVNTTHSISQSGPYIYLNGRNGSGGGVLILDLTTNPEAPTPRGSWDTKYIHDCRVLNDTIWACNIYTGDITIINAANKNSLQTVTSWQNLPNPFPHNCAITADRKYIFTTDETSSPNGKLKVWDITSLSNVQLVTNWQPTGITTAIVHNVEIYGNIAVVAHYTAGIRVIDISNPLNPTEIAWYDTYPSNNSTGYNGCWGVYMFPSGKIIGSDRQTGLYVVRPTTLTGVSNTGNNTPTSFSLYQNFPNPFNPSTTIKFSLPKNTFVNIKVYDITGKKVAQLVDDYKTAGEYEVNYDASALASGVYFYTLKSDGFAETKRMTLVK
jgi:choice-of-anchor B domain-containing protein